MSKERDLLVSCLDEFQYHDVPCSDLIRTIKWLLNEPEQPEPVAWRYKTHNRYTYTETHYSELKGEGEPLYTAPQKREPLSDKEILNLWANKSPANEFECVRLVEKAHGIGGGNE